MSELLTASAVGPGARRRVLRPQKRWLRLAAILLAIPLQRPSPAAPCPIFRGSRDRGRWRRPAPPSRDCASGQLRERARRGDAGGRAHAIAEAAAGEHDLARGRLSRAYRDLLAALAADPACVRAQRDLAIASSGRTRPRPATEQDLRQCVGVVRQYSVDRMSRRERAAYLLLCSAFRALVSARAYASRIRYEEERLNRTEAIAAPSAIPLKSGLVAVTFLRRAMISPAEAAAFSSHRRLLVRPGPITFREHELMVREEHGWRIVVPVVLPLRRLPASPVIH